MMRSFNPKLSATALICIVALLPQIVAAELRCGWVDNPTPGNWWLTDRDGEWTLMVQGVGDRDNGFIDIPNGWDFGDQWRQTNGSYGYGCGCFAGQVDKATNWASEVTQLSALPLATCENDKSLPAR